MSLESQHAFFEDFAKVSSLDELTRLLRRVSDQLEFEWCVYALGTTSATGEARLALVDGYPEPWIEHYFREGYLTCDPVMRYCQAAVLPIRWDNLSDLRDDERLLMHRAAEFGLQRGVSAPLHGPHGELGVLSVATSQHPKDVSHRLARASIYLPALAGYVHHTLRRVLPEEEHRVKPLSERERECLSWVTEGKTSWEIGNILGISERTVHFHLGNACRKLGVNNRQHAVARALLLGLLDGPPPVRTDSVKDRT